MRVLFFLCAIFCFFKTASAKSINTEHAISLGGFYGNTNYSKPKHTPYKNNNINSTLNAYGKISYNLANDYTVSLDGYFMIDSAKEVENYNQGIWGEEVFTTLETPMGDFSLGQDYNVAYNFAVGAPNVGSFRINNSDITNFIHNSNWFAKNGKTSYKTLNSTYINTDGASLKVNYTTPSWRGIKLGATFVPKVDSRSGLVSNNASYENNQAYVLAGLGEWYFSGFEVATSLGFAEFDENDKEYSAGVSIYRKGWTLGASYRKSKAIKKHYTIDETTMFDAYRSGYAYSVGLSYEIGPFTTGVSYFNSKSDEFNISNEILGFSNSYKFNKNTSLSLTIAQLKANDMKDKTKGFAGIIGLEFSL